MGNEWMLDIYIYYRLYPHVIAGMDIRILLSLVGIYRRFISTEKKNIY